MTLASAGPAPPLAGGRIALVGNPNTGKTTLFNRLCGLRAHTANYPGITVDARQGKLRLAPPGHNRATHPIIIVDLPGAYGLGLDLPESRFCHEVLAGKAGTRPDAVVMVLDASNLERNLGLAAEVIATGLPCLVALNMVDQAERRHLRVNVEELARRLGCPVVPLSARSGRGLEALIAALPAARPGRIDLPKQSPDDLPADPEARSPVSAAGDAAAGDPSEALARWAAEVDAACTEQLPGHAQDASDRWDRLLTHTVYGNLIFLAVMGGLFWCIFALAQKPMEWTEVLFSALGGLAADTLPAGAMRDLLVDGVIGGVAGTVVFLPQICLLFFLLTLLEDTGYLARAAFVADRLLRPFGLPGQAFVPLLSSHACALPGILCARLIPDRSERLTTILVAPLMSCSARLPVYVLLIGLLVPDRPLVAGLLFVGCYVLGAGVALLLARLWRSTILPGAARPLMLELPPFRRPSLRNALGTALDRGLLFLRKAGTVILAICIVLWWLSAYPRLEETPPALAELRAAAATYAPEEPRHEELAAQASALEGRLQLEHSFAGRLGKLVEPVFRPLDYDWQLCIAVMTSYAAREVFVSTLAVIFQADPEQPERVTERVRAATRDDGRPLLDAATAASLLVFYVLSLQCLPTLAVTRREAGGRRWALLQFASLSIIAYALAWLAGVLVRAALGGSA